MSDGTSLIQVEQKHGEIGRMDAADVARLSETCRAGRIVCSFPSLHGEAAGSPDHKAQSPFVCDSPGE
jgi:hypothetical protein